MAKYSKSSQNEVEKEMRRFKRGTAHSGPKNKTVKSRKQAIAIALSKARKKGAKVPKKATGSTSKTKSKTKGKTKSKSTRSKKKTK